MISAVDKSNLVGEDWIWLIMIGVDTLACTISSTSSLVRTASASGEGFTSGGVAWIAAVEAVAGRAGLWFVRNHAPAASTINRSTAAAARVSAILGFWVTGRGGAMVSTPESNRCFNAVNWVCTSPI